MTTKNLLTAVLLLSVGAIAGFTIAKSDFGHHKHRDWDHDRTMGTHKMSDGKTMKDDAHGDMGHMMVTSEQSFIEGMIPHHAEAVATAKEVLARGGTTAEIKQLAENIVAAQEKEIADMKAWYETWYKKPYADTGAYTPMMRELEKLSGAELDKAFLEDMVMHHMGALMMAEGVKTYITHEELTNLTKAILETQSTEIQKMKLMLQSL